MLYRFCKKIPKSVNHHNLQYYLVGMCILSLQYVLSEGSELNFEQFLSDDLLKDFDHEQIIREILIVLDFNLILASPYYFFQNFIQNDEFFENNELNQDEHKNNMALVLMLFNLCDQQTINDFNEYWNMPARLALDCIFNAYEMTTSATHFLNISMQKPTDRLKDIKKILCYIFHIEENTFNRLKIEQQKLNYPKYDVNCDKPKANITTNRVENLEIFKVLGEGTYGKVELIKIDDAEYAMKTFFSNDDFFYISNNFNRIIIIKISQSSKCYICR
jgi:hypothetical protein